MKYILEIVIDDKANEPTCFVVEDNYTEESFKVIVRTPSNSKLDFKKMNIATIDQNALDFIMGNTKLEETDGFAKSMFVSLINSYFGSDHEKIGADIILDAFLNSFAYGKDVISNSVLTTIRVNEKDVEDIRDYNYKIYNYLNENKKLLNNNIIVSSGFYTYCDEDYEKVKMFNDLNIKFIMNNKVDILTAKGLGTSVNLINKIYNEVDKQDLSQIEKAMYAYDLLRVNNARSLDNNSKEELDINELVNSYNEPSDFYSTVFTEILTKLGIKCVTATGEFYPDEERKYTVCYIDDYKYDIEGVYYFDIGINSIQSIKNSLAGNFDEKNHNCLLDVLSTYSGFAKTKSDMECRGFLNFDYLFADFDDSCVDILEDLESEKVKRYIPNFLININNISNFIEDKLLVHSRDDLQDEDKLEEIEDKLEEYLDLFKNDISAEDFLEILFNVRKVEYKHNKEIYKISTTLLKNIVYNSGFSFINNSIDEEEMENRETEDLIREDIENNFEDFSIKHNVDNEIKKLKLTMFNEEERKKREDKDK